MWKIARTNPTLPEWQLAKYEPRDERSQFCRNGGPGGVDGRNKGDERSHRVVRRAQIARTKPPGALLRVMIDAWLQHSKARSRFDERGRKRSSLRREGPRRGLPSGPAR